jgi:hypothetical protein
MKTVVALFYPPDEFCLMDDDVFILSRLDDALAAFRTHNLVFTTNLDESKEYREIWQKAYPDLPQILPTGTFNAGLYWLRNTKDPRALLARAKQVSATILPQNWEQGFIAVTFADETSFELPHQRYYAPAIDGLPGGMMGYDYARNPCGFASIHFLGMMRSDKPSDGKTLYLAPQILQARR